MTCLSLITASLVIPVLAVPTDIPGPRMASWKTSAVTVTPCGNRQRFPYGGNDEQRICRSPTSDQTSAGGSIRRSYLSVVKAVPQLVPYVVATLSGTRPQRAVRSQPDDCATFPDCARSRACHPRDSSTAGVSSASRHALQPDWGQCDSSRTPGFAYSVFTQPADHRTGAGAERGHSSPRAFGAVFSQHHLSRTPSQRVQSTASGRQRWPDLSERQPATVLHLRRQGCVRWRGLPKTLPFPQDGSRARLLGRVLEKPRPAAPGAIRQCPRSDRLGTRRPLSLAGPALVLAVWHRTSVNPTGTTSTPRQCRKLQRLVPPPLVSTPLHAPECLEARTPAPAGNRQYPTHPTTLGRFTTVSLSTAAQITKVTPRLPDPARPVAHCRRSDHFHPASHPQRQHSFAQPDLQSGQTSER